MAQASEQNEPVFRDVNVGSIERLASVAVGAGLAAYAVRGRPRASGLMGLAGGLLLSRGATGHCPAYGAFGVSTASHEGYHSPSAVMHAHEGVRVDETIVVDRPVALVYAFWRSLDNLPTFMSHLVSVKTFGNRSHWVAKGPAGTLVEWDAEIINDVENELIAWKSLPESTVENAGSVHFESLNDDELTRVRVVLKYVPPAGKLGVAVARLFGGDAKTEIEQDLREFKRHLESEPLSEGELSVLKRHSRRRPLKEQVHEKTANDVDESSKESFPASDAPSWVSSRRSH